MFRLYGWQWFQEFQDKAEGTPEPQDLKNSRVSAHPKELSNSTEGTQGPQNDSESPKQALLEPQVEANCMCDKVLFRQTRGRSMMRRCHRVRTSPPTGSPVDDDVDQVPRRHGYEKVAAAAAAAARRSSAGTWAGDSNWTRRVLCATRRAIVEARVVNKRRIVGARGLSFFRRQVHRHGRVAHMRAVLLCTHTPSQMSGDLEGSDSNFAPQEISGDHEVSEGKFAPRFSTSWAGATRTALRQRTVAMAFAKFPAPAPGPQSSQNNQTPSRKGSKAKPCLHAALARLVAKPPASDVFLKRLQKLVKGAEAGHYLLDSPSVSSTAGPQNTQSARKESVAAEAPKDTPKKAMSILKKNPPKPLTEVAVGSNPLLEYALRDEDWKGMAIMKQASVLSKLQRGEAPGPQPVAAILSEEAAEEVAALWKQHSLNNEVVGLTCVIGRQSAKDVAWCPKHGLAPKTQWLSLRHGDKTVLQEVFVAKGAGREASSRLTSDNLLKLPGRSSLSSRTASVSTFKVGVGAKSAKSSHASCSTFRVGATPKSARGTKVTKASELPSLLLRRLPALPGRFPRAL